MLKKRFSFLSFGLLPLLVGLMSIGALDFGTAQAQTAAFTRAKDTVSVQLANTGASGKQDFLVANQTIDSLKAYVSGLTAGASYIVRFAFRAGVLKFTGDSVVVKSSNSSDSLWAYKTGTPMAMPATNKILAQGYSTSDFTTVDTLMVGIKVAAATDTVYVLGAKVMPVSSSAATGTYTASNAGTTTDSLGVGVDTVSHYPSSLTALSYTGTLYKLLPGSFYAVTSVTPSGATSITAGTQQATVTATLTDAYGNTVSDTTTYPTATAVLASDGTSPGNGTLTLAGKFHTAAGAVQEGFTYTKAEPIQIKLAGPGSGSTPVNTGTITVNPGAPANISVALVSGYSDTLSVTGKTEYTVSVTDAYFNPVSDTNHVKAVEKTAHGGTFDAATYATSGGEATVIFTPSHFFVGTDTLVFTAPALAATPTATQSRRIVINAGPLGGVIADYAGTNTGAASSEQIAAGAPVYLRAYLRDSYGNPINATDTSAVSFAMNLATKTHGGVLTPSGKALVSIPASQASATFGKPLQSAVTAIAIPYSASDTSGNTDNITLETATGAYTTSASLVIRSNVPAKMKMAQTTGTDSSIVVSNYANSIAFSDTLWDAYGNLVVAPSSSIKIAPTRSSYAVYFSTNGYAKFVRTADTTKADTLYPNSNGAVTRTVASGKATGMDTVKTWTAASASIAKSAPILVTPGTFTDLVLTPAKDTTAIAGQSQTFTVEKQDAYGNHIDWGMAGNQTVAQYKASYYVSGKLDTTKLNVPIDSDLNSLTADTVSTGHNRGGSVSQTFSTSGSSALASVGGSLDATFKFTAYAAGPDTQKVYVSLSGIKDTSIVYSMSTGTLAGFTITIPAADSVESAGDSVKVTATAVDSAGHQIYTYYGSDSLSLTLNNTNVMPIATKDTTFYFTVIRNHKGTVKAGDTLRVTGAGITDSLFNQGEATFWLRKFTAENMTNTVTLASAGFTATTTNGTRFKPLSATAAGTGSKWAITGPDTLSPNGSFTFTIVPRDKYYNVDSVNQYIVNVSSNQTSGFNVGSNPKVVKGPSSFSGTLSGATGSLVVYVFSSDNSALYTSKNVVITGQQFKKGDVSGNGTVTAFDASLILKYVVGDTSLTQAQLTAADVSGDGTVSAYDASLVLRYVAGDTTVNSYFMSMVAEGQKSKHMTVSSLPSSGSVALSSVEASGSDGVMNMPVSVTDPQNVYAVQLSLNVGSGVDVQGVTANLPQDWQLAYHTANGVLKIAMAGTSPLTSGKIAAIAFKVADQAKSTVTGTATINENASQALGSMEVAAIPTKFGLDQNYPNPFNPTTTIKYQLAKQANVTMNIYSITGQLVRTLVSQNQKAGYYTIMWNGLNNAGEQVASGVYFYRLQAGSFLSLKKMLLLK